MITAQALTVKFEQALKEKWGYIWGTSGETWTAAKQAKLDAAKRAAENDTTQEGEVKKLQSQVSKLEKEAKKIQNEIYSS